ncbi:MAG: hypothetical protein MUQ30_05160 [Anaerolineae bacterium]|nr:hypothetical protein [Anaerolineae bacterium]
MALRSRPRCGNAPSGAALAHTAQWERTIPMAQEITTRREKLGFPVTSYVIQVAASVVGLRSDFPTSVTLRCVIVILLVAIAALQMRVPKAVSPRWRIHL